jgi:hypothetical protein
MDPELHDRRFVLHALVVEVPRGRLFTTKSKHGRQVTQNPVPEFMTIGNPGNGRSWQQRPITSVAQKYESCANSSALCG